MAKPLKEIGRSFAVDLGRKIPAQLAIVISSLRRRRQNRRLKLAIDGINKWYGGVFRRLSK